jgi:hypothetical protein
LQLVANKLRRYYSRRIDSEAHSRETKSRKFSCDRFATLTCSIPEKQLRERL